MRLGHGRSPKGGRQHWHDSMCLRPVAASDGGEQVGGTSEELRAPAGEVGGGCEEGERPGKGGAFVS